jgi:two-component system CheB/CheR fusion protein
VAGVVASAGGLDAFKKLFAAMPPDTGIGFVLIPHLDPGRESFMVELLARHTALPIIQAANDMPVEANHIYVIPPNKYMTIRGGILRLTGPVERYASPTSIDLFLRSLADDRQERSICIILSGTGSHGSLGLKAVKAAGGLAMVQDPATAEYDRMPQSAVATGLADYVLPVEQMPEALVKYARHAYLNGGTRVRATPETPEDLNQVLALVSTRAKFDFRCYRKKMLARRIERRMGLAHIDSFPEYVKFLRANPDELQQLTKDVWISVTSFFRDPEAFQQLADKVVAPLVRSKQQDATIRVWVAGCATGEEAYSIAMLFLEKLAAQQKSCSLQVFATDVDEDAREVARRGFYPDTISADVSPERLARFFTRVDAQTYQVGKAVRETVTFAVHNVITEAPFTRLDLISCRNLLIYLEPEVQRKLIPLFHFALNAEGFLFLGPSETIGRDIDLFEPLDKHWRIYRRIGPVRRERLDFPSTGVGRERETGPPADAAGPRSVKFPELMQRLLMEQFGLAAALINRKYEVLYYFGPCTLYFEFPPGEATHDVIRMARDGLRNKLRTAVHRAIEDNDTVVVTVRVKRDGGYHSVRVTVRPVQAPRAAEGLLLVTFEGAPEQPPSAATAAEPEEAHAGESALRQLEAELKNTREDLECTIEELESSNEELKAANEETLSINEELHAANEELESSKEELQSVNEELTTVNVQLQEKIKELEGANDDMANLLNSTDIATVFLDRAFRIKLFTPAAARLFHLIASDAGRPLSDIALRFSDPVLLDDARGVLQELVPREKEVTAAEGDWWVRRIMPYRTRDDRIQGVVITFADITERKRASDVVVRRLAAIVENSADAIFSKDLDGTIRTWNRGAERLYGYKQDEIVGQSVKVLIPEERAEAFASIMARLQRGEPTVQLETERLHKDGHRISVALTVSPVRDSSGKVVSASAIGRDISERKQAEQALRDREERLQAILNGAVDAIITIDHQGIIQAVNPATEKMFGYAANEMVGQNVRMLMPAPYTQEHDGYVANYLKTGVKKIIGIGREVVAQRDDGTTFPVDLAVNEIPQLRLFTGIIRDISRRRELEREVVEVASLEQRRIGHDLHDSVAQELTALSMLAGDVAETLRTDPANAAHLVEQIIKGLQRSQQTLRAVLRGLLPVAVDREGLMNALADLAQRTQKESAVTCTFDCPTSVSVADNLVATHLYLIAQEAVHNALKHGRPRKIGISLVSNQVLVLRVQDDGLGMPAQATEQPGLGLRIMRNRAGIIGATLAIAPVQPTGTLVTCFLARSKNDQKQ